MSCNHPRDRWVGMSDGIHCADCGALIDLGKKAEPKVEAPEPEPEKKAGPKKAAPKKGGKK